jgi:acyl-CoA reductase-like NAD-dependent aldehyde dehydrogenase
MNQALQIDHHIDPSAKVRNNHCPFRQANMSFAGLRHSGSGVGGIGHTIDDMQTSKMLVMKTPLS